MATYSPDEIAPTKNEYSLDDVVQPVKKDPIPAHLRFIRGLHEPIDGLAQMLYNAVPESAKKLGDSVDDWLFDKTGGMLGSEPGSLNKNLADREKAYRANAPEGVDWARAGGNYITALLGTRGAPMPTSFGGAVASNTVIGSGLATTTPVYSEDVPFWETKRDQAAIGAVTGAALTPATHALGRLIAPKAASNPDVKKLAEEGTKPTLGQVLGGPVGRAEEKLTSLPILGDMISKSRTTALETFNKSAINEVLKPISKTVDEIGSEGVKRASQLVSQAYDDALNGLKGVTLDKQAILEISNLRKLAKGLPKDQTRQFEKFLNDSIKARMSPAGGLEARTFKSVESELRQKAGRYGKSPVAAEKDLGNAFEELLSIMRNTASRQNPTYANELSKANAAFARLVRLQGASKKAAAAETGGMFTPNQLMTAVREADQSARKNATAQGAALMQDLAGAGSRVLGNKVANSGTTDRALLNAGAAGGAAMLDPSILIGLLMGGSAYTKPIQSALVTAATKRPESAKAIADVVRHATPGLTLPTIGLLQPSN